MTDAFRRGLASRARALRRLRRLDESKALRHLFFAEREAAKVPDVPKDTPAADIKRAAVVGAGTMGGGIAMNYANAGIPVLLKEVDEAGARSAGWPRFARTTNRRSPRGA